MGRNAAARSRYFCFLSDLGYTSKITAIIELSIFNARRRSLRQFELIAL
jgi:hypothetical protein